MWEMQIKTIACYFLIIHIGKYFKSSTKLVWRGEMGSHWGEYDPVVPLIDKICRIKNANILQQNNSTSRNLSYRHRSIHNPKSVHTRSLQNYMQQHTTVSKFEVLQWGPAA